MMDRLTLPPLRTAVGGDPPAGFEEHIQPHAAAGGAGAGQDRDPRPARFGRYPGDVAALARVGVGVTAIGHNAWAVEGCGGAFPVRDADLFMGNAGTAIRPLTAALALSGGHYRLSGVPRMHERPIGDLVDGLLQIGADVRYTGNSGFPPLAIHPAAVKLDAPIRLRGDVSSQFLTALLMALPLTGQRGGDRDEHRADLQALRRDHAEPDGALRRHGRTRGLGALHDSCGGSAYRSPGVLHVEGDASAASYFLAAGAIGGGPVRVEGVGRGSIQGDVRLPMRWRSDGCAHRPGARTLDRGVAGRERPAQGLRPRPEPHSRRGDDAGRGGAVCRRPCRLRNIASWRVKETDRITAMATELRKLGALVEEGDDHIAVSPAPTLTAGAAIDTYDDHRMAMCFSLAALGGVPVTINDPACVNKTFPDYFDAFAEIAAPVIAIDGPSASGKGTVAERVAAALGYHYLDSGSLYRLTALAGLRAGKALDDEAGLAAVAASLPARFSAGRIYLNEDDVTDAIRTEEISVGASKVAALPAVRAALLSRQRAYRRFPGLVADGRDMASVVFPGAVAKVFLTASAAARAERRYKQLIAKGMPANMHALLQDLQDRDARDAQRSVAPLRQCDDADLVDTTELDIEAAVSAVMAIAKRQGL
jgi:3-phosphoshikimate 1-carboxyvinyltransferase